MKQICIIAQVPTDGQSQHQKRNKEIIPLHQQIDDLLKAAQGDHHSQRHTASNISPTPLFPLHPEKRDRHSQRHTAINISPTPATRIFPLHLQAVRRWHYEP